MKHPLFSALLLILLGAAGFALPMASAFLGLVDLIGARLFTFAYLILVYGGAVIMGLGVVQLQEWRKTHKNRKHFIDKPALWKS